MHTHYDVAIAAGSYRSASADSFQQARAGHGSLALEMCNGVGRESSLTATCYSNKNLAGAIHSSQSRGVFAYGTSTCIVRRADDDLTLSEATITFNTPDGGNHTDEDTNFASHCPPSSAGGFVREIAFSPF